MKSGVYSGREGYILGGSHIVVEKGGLFWGGGVDSRRVAKKNWLKRGVYSGRERYTVVEKRSIFWDGGVDY